MLGVEICAAVRRFVFVEGKSRREAARVFGLSRDTISKMCRYSVPPGYVRSKAPERPKLGPLVPVIAILEDDKTAPPKQRHTAKRIFERLRIEHGYAGGYTVVKDYVRIARARSRDVFVPLEFCRRFGRVGVARSDQIPRGAAGASGGGSAHLAGSVAFRDDRGRGECAAGGASLRRAHRLSVAVRRSGHERQDLGRFSCWPRGGSGSLSHRQFRGLGRRALRVWIAWRKTAFA